MCFYLIYFLYLLSRYDIYIFKCDIPRRFEGSENVTLSCSTKVCSFGSEVVEKVRYFLSFHYTSLHLNPMPSKNIAVLEYNLMLHLVL